MNAGSTESHPAPCSLVSLGCAVGAPTAHIGTSSACSGLGPGASVALVPHVRPDLGADHGLELGHGSEVAHVGIEGVALDAVEDSRPINATRGASAGARSPARPAAQSAVTGEAVTPAVSYMACTDAGGPLAATTALVGGSSAAIRARTSSMRSAATRSARRSK